MLVVVVTQPSKTSLCIWSILSSKSLTLGRLGVHEGFSAQPVTLHGNAGDYKNTQTRISYSDFLPRFPNSFWSIAATRDEG